MCGDVVRLRRTDCARLVELRFPSDVGGRTETTEPQSMRYPAVKRSRFVVRLGEPDTTPIIDCPWRFPTLLCDLWASLRDIVGRVVRCNT